jgi:hypothetical protein
VFECAPRVTGIIFILSTIYNASQVWQDERYEFRNKTYKRPGTCANLDRSLPAEPGFLAWTLLRLITVRPSAVTTTDTLVNTFLSD